MTDLIIWIVAGIIALVVASALVEAYLKRDRYQLLADKQPQKGRTKNKKRELGQEATDLDMVENVHRENERHERMNWGIYRPARR